MRRWLPDTVQGQIVIILVGALATTLLSIVFLLRLLRPDVPPIPPGPWAAAVRTTTIAEALHAAPIDGRAALAAALSDERIAITVGPPPACPLVAEPYRARGLRLVLQSMLGRRLGPVTYSTCGPSPDAAVTRLTLSADKVTLSVLSEGVSLARLSQDLLVVLPLAVGLGFLLTLLVALSLWTFWRVNRPLRRMARTVERFGLDVAEEPLPETGLREFRRLAQAFNRMQRRIAQLVVERSRMLITVGHDLRTPLTRLKLRIELGDEDAPRPVLLRELALMQRMIDGALSFLDDRQSREPVEEVDLGGLVESICIEFTDAGRTVAYAGDYGLICPCQPTAVTRAVNNLIENACRYGTRVAVNVRRQGDAALIEVQDDGPGIPPEMRDAVLEPFTRLDAARASDGGLGLGLSVVRDVVRRHGAQLFLLDAKPRGLMVRILLPLV